MRRKEGDIDVRLDAEVPRVLFHRGGGMKSATVSVSAHVGQRAQQATPHRVSTAVITRSGFCSAQPPHFAYRGSSGHRLVS